MTKSILTNREKEIFSYLINDYSTKRISYLLGISEKTVRNHISNVIQKLGSNSRSGAILELIKLNEFTL
ncbi:MAG: LuxR C-terminal-related transcriptional regulator [Bacilli bacterium]|nr:LuxR C-terminal-related transcriptional regulator [Bacilli bacterium]